MFSRSAVGMGRCAALVWFGLWAMPGLTGCDPGDGQVDPTPDVGAVDASGLDPDGGPPAIDGATVDAGSPHDPDADLDAAPSAPDADPPDGLPPEPDAAPLEPDVLPPEPTAALALNEVSCRDLEFVEVAVLQGGRAAGWQVTDDPADPARSADLPAAVVEADTRVLMLDLPFGIACDDTISLLSPDRTVVETVRLDPPPEGATRGRLPDGVGAWADTLPTPGSPNAPLPPAVVRLNEVDCHGREYIELINLGQHPVDLAGWRVSDEPDDAEAGYDLAGAVLQPGQIVDVRRQTADDVGFTFGIACGADRVVLRDADGAEVDAVDLPRLPAAYTWGRLPDGQGPWARTGPTRGAPNAALVEPSGELFDPMRVVALHFEVSPENLARLGDQPREYVPATMRHEDGEPMPVGFRLKGRAGSFRTLDRKSAFKVQIDWESEDANLFGQRRLTLNNMVQDRSMIHEWTSYTIFRAMGVVAPRVGYAWVTVNGEAYGLYSNIEALEDELLDRHFVGTENLYEGAYGADLFPDHIGRFDRDEGDLDPAELEAVIALMHAVEPAEFYAASQDLIDWPQALAMMVTEIYIGHWDGYAPTRNNYYLHFDDDGVMRLMPWGTDQTFARHLPIRDGRGLLLERCRASVECLEAFDRTLLFLVATLDELALVPQIEAIALSHRDEADADPRKAYDIGAIDRGVQDTINFLATRRADVGELVDCLTADDPDPDGDGFICDRDCNPDDPLTYPGASEICGDFIDQDCNGYADDSPECPDCEEVLHDGRRYLVCTTPRAYVDAVARCREHGAEGWVPDGPREAAIITQAALQIRNQDYWIGLDDLENEGEFVWPDGIERPWENWNDGEPNNAGNEDCAHIWARNGRWNDLPCDRRQGIICEVPCDPATDADSDGSTACGQDCADEDPERAPGLFDVCNDGVDQDCNGEVDDGEGCVRCDPLDLGPHRYLICRSALPYADARDACVDMGLDLAVLADADEARRVADDVRAIRRGEYWIGLDDTAAEGTFRWVDGREVAPDAPWAPGEPNDYNNNEDCAHLRADQPIWNDLPCGVSRGFICEPPCPRGQDEDGDGVPRCDGDCDDSDPAVGRCGPG